jgi:hypothetical protein
MSTALLPISKITTFGCEKENVRAISGCEVIRKIEMKLAVSQTLICTTADDILLF